jgi:ribonuclease T2
MPHFTPIPKWIPNENGHTGAPYNNFSLYILRQQWSAEWCCREQTHGWCLDILSSPYREKLVLHGLWPGYSDARSLANKTNTYGYWPQFCKQPDFDYKVCYSVGRTSNLPVECSIPTKDRELLHDDWMVYAPGYPFNKEDASRGWNLGDHEYAKHGTCTNLTSTVFLQESIRLMKVMETPSQIYLNVGQNIKLSDLQHSYRYESSTTNDYTKAAAFSCSADGNFFSVSTCWSINIATGRPNVRIDCPDTVLRNKYSNNCSLNKNGMVFIRGAFPGQCRAPLGVPSGVHIFVIAVIVFGTLLVTACFIKMIRELCLESQNDDDDEEEDRAGYKSFS